MMATPIPTNPSSMRAALALVLVLGCGDTGSAPGPSAPVEPVRPAATGEPATPANLERPATPAERSPRCFAACNERLKVSKTSMCKFCRAHQIGAPAKDFEAWDRRCTETCEQEWRSCFDPCVTKESPPP